MATTSSRSPAWWRILQLLLVLLATTAQSREFVQDIGVNGIQEIEINGTRAWVSTFEPHTIIKVTGPEDQAVYDNAVCKGGNHIKLMEGDTVIPSPFDTRDSLFDNGWVGSRLNPVQGDNPPPSYGDYETALDDDMLRIYGNLGISTTPGQENPFYLWSHGPRSQKGLGHTKVTYGQPDDLQNYFLANAPFGKTKGYYSNFFNPASGMVLCYNNYGPQAMIAKRGTQGPAPPMNRLSDVLWYQWADACQTTGHDPGNIKYFYRHNIIEKLTRRIMKVIEAKPGVKWPGRMYSMNGGTESEETQIAKALLGTPNGHAVGFFLAQHRREIKKKLTVDRVQFWGEPDPSGQRDMLFYVVEVIDA
ncbi:hypothetical protein LTR53_009021 [Teratosphaeriaceae sp. CCFEE 6253]|nr:hypothetical protein LTR53_009021 [Teratosphaeriaceae sp. CCFEE 6253]